MSCVDSAPIDKESINRVRNALEMILKSPPPEPTSPIRAPDEERNDGRRGGGEGDDARRKAGHDSDDDLSLDEAQYANMSIQQVMAIVKKREEKEKRENGDYVDEEAEDDYDDDDDDEDEYEDEDEDEEELVYEEIDYYAHLRQSESEDVIKHVISEVEFVKVDDSAYHDSNSGGSIANANGEKINWSSVTAEGDGSFKQRYRKKKVKKVDRKKKQTDRPRTNLGLKQQGSSSDTETKKTGKTPRLDRSSSLQSSLSAFPDFKLSALLTPRGKPKSEDNLAALKNPAYTDSNVKTDDEKSQKRGALRMLSLRRKFENPDAVVEPTVTATEAFKDRPREKDEEHQNSTISSFLPGEEKENKNFFSSRMMSLRKKADPFEEKYSQSSRELSREGSKQLPIDSVQDRPRNKGDEVEEKKEKKAASRMLSFRKKSELIEPSETSTSVTEEPMQDRSRDNKDVEEKKEKKPVSRMLSLRKKSEVIAPCEVNSVREEPLQDRPRNNNKVHAEFLPLNEMKEKHGSSRLLSLRRKSETIELDHSLSSVDCSSSVLLSNEFKDKKSSSRFLSLGKKTQEILQPTTDVLMKEDLVKSSAAENKDNEPNDREQTHFFGRIRSFNHKKGKEIVDIGEESTDERPKNDDKSSARYVDVSRRGVSNANKGSGPPRTLSLRKRDIEERFEDRPRNNNDGEHPMPVRERKRRDSSLSRMFSNSKKGSESESDNSYVDRPRGRETSRDLSKTYYSKRASSRGFHELSTFAESKAEDRRENFIDPGLSSRNESREKKIGMLSSVYAGSKRLSGLGKQPSRDVTIDFSRGSSRSSESSVTNGLLDRSANIRSPVQKDLSSTSAADDFLKSNSLDVSRRSTRGFKKKSKAYDIDPSLIQYIGEDVKLKTGKEKEKEKKTSKSLLSRLGSKK